MNLMKLDEQSLSISISYGGEYYMIFKGSVQMDSSQQNFLYSDISGLPDTISGAEIPAQPETGVEKDVYVTSVSNTGFTLKASRAGEGEFPLTIKILILGG